MTDEERDLAEAHVQWYMRLMRQQFQVWADITERLMIDNFIHGIKHGREIERETQKKNSGRD